MDICYVIMSLIMSSSSYRISHLLNELREMGFISFGFRVKHRQRLMGREIQTNGRSVGARCLLLKICFDHLTMKMEAHCDLQVLNRDAFFSFSNSPVGLKHTEEGNQFDTRREMNSFNCFIYLLRGTIKLSKSA